MSEKDKTVVNNNGIGFCGLLTIVFITLKLTHTIDWEWLWVLAPIWIPAAIAVSVIAIVGIVLLVAYFIDKKK